MEEITAAEDSTNEAKTPKMKLVTPRRLKGFPDFFAEDMKLREFVIGIFTDTFEKYGYEPLETPTLEYSELVLGQSGEEAEKQFYRFEDPGGRDVMLRYEVMIAMCRAVGENYGKIPMPYKRYQIQRCFRAENTQKGRYREFTQCDADTIGSSSMLCDAEFIQMGLEVVKKLGFKVFVVRISNRKFLEGLAETFGVSKEQFYGFCMSLDKLQKIGRDGVLAEMTDRRGIDADVVKNAIDAVAPENAPKAPFRKTIERMKAVVKSSQIGSEGLDELSQIADYFETVGIDENLYTFDTSLARGLASYTGPVWEFEIIDGGVGSIAGCGRYDRAIAKYIGREIPATGGSFGIERICDILKDRKMIDLGKTTVSVMVTIFDDTLWSESLLVADKLRRDGISVMLYPQADGLKKQFKFASEKGIPWVVVIGPDEMKSKKVQLKNMESGKQEESDVSSVAAKIKGK